MELEDLGRDMPAKSVCLDMARKRAGRLLFRAAQPRRSLSPSDFIGFIEAPLAAEYLAE